MFAKLSQRQNFFSQWKHRMCCGTCTAITNSLFHALNNLYKKQGNQLKRSLRFVIYVSSIVREELAAFFQWNTIFFVLLGSMFLVLFNFSIFYLVKFYFRILSRSLNGTILTSGLWSRLLTNRITHCINLCGNTR